jgi:hypothetical protein
MFLRPSRMPANVRGRSQGKIRAVTCSSRTAVRTTTPTGTDYSGPGQVRWLYIGTNPAFTRLSTKQSRHPSLRQELLATGRAGTPPSKVRDQLPPYRVTTCKVSRRRDFAPVELCALGG